MIKFRLRLHLALIKLQNIEIKFYCIREMSPNSNKIRNLRNLCKINILRKAFCDPNGHKVIKSKDCIIIDIKN